MAHLFTPPSRDQVRVLKGALRYSYVVTETVWRDANGVWQHQEVPASDTLSAALAGGGVVLAGRPEVISDALAAELTLAGIGSSVSVPDNYVVE